ncbi:hypothetical protein KY284_006532 [Solanum tuberosum]|nr:hypothetical protein KY284_006532 [Solanum tuberosum]
MYISKEAILRQSETNIVATSPKLYRPGAYKHSDAPRQPEALDYKPYTAGYRLLHYISPANRRLYTTSFTQPDTSCFYITTGPASWRLYIASFTQPDTGFYITTGPASRRLYITSFTQPDAGFLHYNRPASRGPLHYKLLYLHHTHNKHQQSTKHYNEELPLSSKLGQVSAMSSITSYVNDSLSKLSPTRFSEVQI